MRRRAFWRTSRSSIREASILGLSSVASVHRSVIWKSLKISLCLLMRAFFLASEPSLIGAIIQLCVEQPDKNCILILCHLAAPGQPLLFPVDFYVSNMGHTSVRCLFAIEIIEKKLPINRFLLEILLIEPSYFDLKVLSSILLYDVFERNGTLFNLYLTEIKEVFEDVESDDSNILAVKFITN